MAQYPEFVSAGADFADAGFFAQDDGDTAVRQALIEFTAYGDGYVAFEEPLGGVDGVFFEEAFVQDGEGEGVLDHSSPLLRISSPASSPTPSPIPSPALSPPSPAPSEVLSIVSTVSLTNSLDDAGISANNTTLTTAPSAPIPPTYTPHPHILADQPAAPPDPNALYTPLTRTHFRTAAAAKAHRTRARLAPKPAADVARVKALGREYWVCRIFNAMINGRCITDGARSVHRARFTAKAAFEALDLEAAAHAVFDEAIAVHERGWNMPGVYHKHTVRGKLVDISGESVELRLSRVCLVLAETKSAVDDAVRGGVTLALLCDNPEARRFTKESNNQGNQKRGERLRQTRTKERARLRAREHIEAVEQIGEVEKIEQVDDSESQELADVQGLAAVREIEE